MISLADAITALTSQPGLTMLRGTVASTSTVTLADATTVTIGVWAGGPPTIGQPCVVMAGKGSLIALPVVDPAASLATDAELAALHTTITAEMDTAVTARVLKAGDTMTGNLILSKSNPIIVLDNTGTLANRDLRYRTSGVNRWTLLVNNTAESGSDAGSDFAIGRYADDGTWIGSALQISRATGLVKIYNGLDATPKAGAIRLLSRNTTSIANNTVTPLTGGWTVLTGDGGNSGILTYSAGIITVTEAGYYDVMATASWATNSTGERRLDLLINGSAAYRVNQGADNTATGLVQTLTIPSRYFAANDTIQVQYYQSSGGALNANSGRWHVRKVAAA